MANTQRNSIMISMGIIIFSTLFWLYTALNSALPIGFAVGVSAAWALAMIALVGGSYMWRYHLQQRSFSGKKQADASTSSHQTRTVEIDLPMDQAYDLALEALKTLDGEPMPVPDDPMVKLETLGLRRKQHLHLQQNDREMGSITAVLKGEALGIKDPMAFSQLTVQLQRIDNHTTRVRIESQPTAWFDHFDMGKNLHYVNTIAVHLRRESQPASATSRLAVADDIDSVQHENDGERASQQTDS